MEQDVGLQLPEFDRDYLEEKGFDYDVIPSGGDLHIVIKDFEFPEAYSPRVADLMIILPAGYPGANLDMFWTSPDVMLASGVWPHQCEHHEQHHGRNWQRWSRHFRAPWRQGVDGLRTFVASVRAELAKGI